jgi:similar to stage IV sporulation protein
MQPISIIKYIRGYLSVKLTGNSPWRFINLCGSHGILIWGLAPYDGGYRFFISLKGFYELRPLLRKTGTRIRIEKRFGLPFFLDRYKGRKIFVLGSALCFVALFILSGHIWNIEINGNSYISDEVLLRILEEENVTFGTVVSAVSCEGLERAIRNACDEVAWTSVKLSGTKLTVDIVENIFIENVSYDDGDTVYDIVASCDGVITHIMTRSGTPLVKSGDTVEAGQVLVAGYIEITDDDGNVTERIYQTADADVMAETTLSYEDIIEKTYTTEIRTGEFAEMSCLRLGVNDISIEIFNPLNYISAERKVSQYENYQTVTDISQVMLSENFYIPLYFEKNIYYETDNITTAHTSSSIKERASANLGKYIDDLEEKSVQIIEKHVMIEDRDGKYSVNGILTAKMSIVQYAPTDISDILTEEGHISDGTY